MFTERKQFTGLSLLGAALMLAVTLPAYAAEVVGVGPDGNTFSQQTQNGSAESEAAAGETAQTAETAAGEAVPDPVPTETAHLDALTQNGQVLVTGSVSGAYSAEDGILYFFELQPWQDEISGQPVASCQEQGSFSFSLPLNEGSVDSRLYSSYVATVWLGGKYQIISNRAYITNPEVTASSRLEYRAPLTKKGLLVQLDMLNDAFELGVKHVNVNFNLAHLTAGTGVSYTYEGKTYQFDAAQIAAYDKTISAFSGKDLMITAIVLNGWNDRMPELVFPGVGKNSQAFYYGFNTATQSGCETTRALLSFLAERYSGENPNYGRVSHWIIGNEINNNLNWNYMGRMDIDRYVREYVRSFRVCYTAIRSHSANARVFFSIDENWNDPAADGELKYSGKAVLDRVNNSIRNGGNLNWNLAYHPYPYPMTEPEFWDDHTTGAVTQNIGTQVIDFENLKVLTDYLCTSEYLAPDGNPRRVILSEQGFTAVSPTRGEVTQQQAAAFAYAYYIADSNPLVDALILSRQVDAPSEVRTSCAFGLWSCRMDAGDQIIAAGRRKIWAVFRDIDKKDKTLEATEFAKPIIGISRWSDVVPNFRWSRQEQ